MTFQRLARLNFVDHLRDDTYSDVKVFVEGSDAKTINAHKVILATASPYFDELLKENPKADVLALKNLKFDIVAKIIEFIYTGSTNVGSDDVADFIEAANETFKLDKMQFTEDEEDPEAQKEDPEAQKEEPKSEPKPSTSAEPAKKKVKKEVGEEEKPKEEGQEMKPKEEKPSAEMLRIPKFSIQPDGQIRCLRCEKTYGKKVHAERHFAEQPTVLPLNFECYLCLSKFKLKTRLNDHLRKKHKISQSMLKTATD